MLSRLFRRYYVVAVHKDQVPASFRSEMPPPLPGYTAVRLGCAAFGADYTTGVFTSRKQAERYMEWYQSLHTAIHPTAVLGLRRTHPLVLMSDWRFQ